MKQIIVLLTVLAVIIIGAFALGQQWEKNKAGDLGDRVGENTASTTSGLGISNGGTYKYVCDNASELAMIPAPDISSVTLIPGKGSVFTQATIVRSPNSAQKFEGDGVVLIGAGEEILLTVGGKTLSCNPFPNGSEAPWNWGDSAEGSGIKQDVALVVSESILGKWQSIDDVKFVRIFKNEGKVDDLYDGKIVASGTFKAVNKMDAVYIEIKESGAQANMLNFKLTKLTPEEIEMIYMDRGGVLRFKAVK